MPTINLRLRESLQDRRLLHQDRTLLLIFEDHLMYQSNYLHLHQSIHLVSLCSFLQYQVLYDYLYVFPEDLGVFTTKPLNIIDITNRNNSYGYSDWRLPTLEEIEFMQANATLLRLDNTYKYASHVTNWGQGKSYKIRLVRTKVIIQQRSEDVQKAYFEETSYDFGDIPILGGIVKTRFCLQNPSSKNVYIKNITKTDSHISVSWDNNYINSSEKGFVTVSYNPNGRQGVSFRSTLVVTLSDGQTLDLIISGRVR